MPISENWEASNWLRSSADSEDWPSGSTIRECVVELPGVIGSFNP